ncbi:MAG: FprA family A-type flavoprotein [Clostridiales Family XIII bacterium]|nr:FprA family A-type flavoprotein [Clostridiales Family XIII bacterium]
MKIKKLTDNFYWVGMLDPDLRIFDIVMETKFGTTYNSYILIGKDKTVLFEASKEKCFDEYIKKVEEITPIKDIDFIIANHTEPDHTGTIEKMLDMNKDLKILGSMGAINFLKEITNKEINGRAIKDGEKIDIGGLTIEFIVAPNLHWPDTIFSYIKEEGILVSCDAFGSHYSDENITDDNLKSRTDYNEALEYYFTNIMGPFKKDVLFAIEKIKNLDIKILAPGHGPVVTTHVKEVIEKYKELATDENKFTKKTVIIPYVTSYGYTKMLAEKIAEGIKSSADIDVKLHDMVYDKFDDVMHEIYFADGFLLGTPTIAGEALPNIWQIAISLNKHIHKGKLVSVFGSFGWSGEGVPNIIQRLKQVSLPIYKDEGLRVRFKPNKKQLEDAFAFGKGYAEELLK